MQNATGRLGAILFAVLGIITLAVASYAAVFPDQYQDEAAYLGRENVLMLPEAVMPAGEINVNTADVNILMQLPGVGEVIAAEIIRERESNGLFLFPEDLLAVRGIGEKKLEGMLPYIRLDEQP